MITEERIENALALAGDAFWSAIDSQFPEIKTGDFPPDAQMALEAAMRRAVLVWLTLNGGTE